MNACTCKRTCDCVTALPRPRRTRVVFQERIGVVAFSEQPHDAGSSKAGRECARERGLRAEMTPRLPHCSAVEAQS